MIEQTFIHLPGIGPAKERLLWRHGVRKWSDLSDALRKGACVPGIVRAAAASPELGSAATSWLAALDESAGAFGRREFGFFLKELAPADHWRLISACLDDALYLDIETTGLSPHFGYVTVVGALCRGTFHQWVWPEPLDELWMMVREAPAVISFNGRRFDLPFLQHHFPQCPEPRAHIDLLPLARKAGIRGGQKAAEVHFGLARPGQLACRDGSDAAAFWSRALYGDEPALGELLRYNREDVQKLPLLAARLYDELARWASRQWTVSLPPELAIPALNDAAAFTTLQVAWHGRRPHLGALEAALIRRFERWPTIVGIDLRGNPDNPTGWACCTGARTKTRILFKDDDILSATLDAKPDIVSIDAPLFLPRGRCCVRDDCPCRLRGGIVRDTERILWRRGISVYPALIRSMQSLTARGILLAKLLCERGVPVIESYPGAAQDILNIARKGKDLALLRTGLGQFGFAVNGEPSHDELDAITSALVGYYYLAGEHEAIGAGDEGFMIVPRQTASMEWHAV